MTYIVKRLVFRGFITSVLLTTAAFAQHSGSPKEDLHIPPHGPSLKGRPAQNFVLQDLSGKSISLRDYIGKPVVVNFWATWCPPCLLEMPWYEELHREHIKTGLTILDISMDIESGSATSETIRAKAAHLHVTYPILLADKSIYASYGAVHLLPETFYINRRGVIVEDVWGHADKESIEKHISEIVK